MKHVDLLDQQQVRGILDSLDLFKPFTEDEKKAFVDLENQFVACDPGEALIEEGNLDASFYILLWGTVHVLKGANARPIAELGPGEFFGEISFLTKSPRTTNVVAHDKVLAIKMDQDTLDQLSAGMREKVKDKIIEKLVERLDQMNKTFGNLT